MNDRPVAQREESDARSGFKITAGSSGEATEAQYKVAGYSRIGSTDQTAIFPAPSNSLGEPLRLPFPSYQMAATMVTAHSKPFLIVFFDLDTAMNFGNAINGFSD